MGPLPRFEVRRGGFPRRRWRFVLVAENGEIVATSEHYTTVQACQEGIEAVREIAGDALVVYV